MSHNIVQKSTHFESFKEHSEHSVQIFSDGTTYTLPDKSIRRLHYHNELEIGICRSGHGMCFTTEFISAISPGDVMIIPPKIPHYSRSLDKCDCEFIFFDIKKLFEYANITITEQMNIDALCATVLKYKSTPYYCNLLMGMVDAVNRPIIPENCFYSAAHRFAIFLLEYSESGSTKLSQSSEDKLLPAKVKML